MKHRLVDHTALRMSRAISVYIANASSAPAYARCTYSVICRQVRLLRAWRVVVLRHHQPQQGHGEAVRAQDGWVQRIGIGINQARGLG